MIADILSTLSVFSQPQVFLFMLFGGALGIFFGAIPGLTGTLALALLLPFTYSMEPQVAFVLIVTLFTSSMYGGSLTAIAVNIPGAPGNVCTTLDGYPMFRKGLGAQAMGLATFSSIVGGVVSAVILTLAAPQLARIALRFGPPEYFCLTLFGMTAVITMGGDKLKGLVSALFGLLLGTMGIDLFNTLRFNFGIQMLNVGMPLLPVVVGLFAFSQVIESINDRKETVGEIFETAVTTRMKFPGLSEIRRLWKTFLRGSLTGTFIGFLPGAGGSISAFVSYNLEKRFSKTPEKFGTGCSEGLASVETANNATCGGALIPLITLGIPGDQYTAIMLGAFIIHGLPVGPLLFRENQSIIYVIFAAALLSNFIFAALGYFGSKYIIRAASVRKSILVPFIALSAITGAFASESSLIHMAIAIAFGAIGYFMKKFGYQVAPVVLGLILSTLMEDSLVQSLIMSQGNFMIFLSRPVSVFLILLTLVFVGTSFIDIRRILNSPRKS